MSKNSKLKRMFLFYK